MAAEVGGGVGQRGSKNTWSAAIVAALGLYALGLALVLTHHEMWRDEIEPWLLARDSPDLLTLFGNVRYEGHPGLWYLVLWGISRLTTSPVAMQAVHGVIACGTALLILRASPFDLWTRILMIFGYFFAFEYAVISRDYGPGVFLLLAACAAYWARNRRWGAFGLLLALAANTGVYQLLLAGTLLAYALARHLWEREPGDRRKDIARGALVALVGFSVAIATFRPPADRPAPHTGVSPERVRQGIVRSVQSLAPTLAPGVAWGWPGLAQTTTSHPTVDRLAGALSRGIGLAAAILAVLLVGREPRTKAEVLFIGMAACSVEAFGVVVLSPGSIRHWGFVYVSLVMFMWLVKARQERDGARRPSWVFTALVLLQVPGALWYGYKDVRGPFTNGRAAAALLSRQFPATPPAPWILADPDYAAQSVEAYLAPTRFYFARGRRIASFVRWDRARTQNPTSSGIDSLLRENPTLQVIVTGYPLAVEGKPPAGWDEIGHFTGATACDEVFYVYRRRPVAASGGD